MLLKFIGNEKLMGLKKGSWYDVEISAQYDMDLIWVHVKWPTRFLSCPYVSIARMLKDWEEL